MSEHVETREISVAALVSITSGILLCRFGDMHEAAKFVMGHPIWTHHFADKDLCDEMRRTVLDQHPELPTKLRGDVTNDNYLQYVAALEAQHGKTLPIVKGGDLTAMLPTDGIPEHLKDKTVVVNVAPPTGEVK